VGAVAVAVALAIPTGAGAGTRDGTAARTTPRQADVTERDFHITAPKQLPKGDVVLKVANLGPDDHQLYMVRVGKRDVPLRDGGLTVDEHAIEHRLVGVLRAGAPGSVRKLRVHLRPGTYELFCNMSGHYLGGMQSRVRVQR
jgi:uncharacterized cupredoxin-like copper-binding protein